MFGVRSGHVGRKTRRALRAGVVVATGLVSAVILPGALAAVGGDIAHPLRILASDGGLGGFTPSSADPKLLKTLQDKQASIASTRGGLYRFTPSGTVQGGDRAITVAVRIDGESAGAVSVRNAAGLAGDAGRGEGLGLAPVKFNLGVARDYQTFARIDEEAPVAGRLALPDSIRELDAPDLSSFTPATRPGKKSRFSTQLAFEGELLPGRAPRTLRGEGDVSLDVGGAYRVADNLKVTAGIRYSADRDRPERIDHGTQDSQSVYVGTRFRF